MLYTEMITTGALIHGDGERYLSFHEAEHPVSLQLGGNDPVSLATCAQLAEKAGYDEINFNVGCPSDRVQSGEFGACLMEYPELVADCVQAMKEAVKVPVTVKTRIGLGKEIRYEMFSQFIDRVSRAGCRCFIIHAREAWLELNAAQNRARPPLNYDFVYQLKKDFPHLEIVINGNVHSFSKMKMHLDHVDGVMLGRLAIENPFLFSEVDALFFNDAHETSTRQQVVDQYVLYAKMELEKGESLSRLILPLMNLYHGMPGACKWRQFLSGKNNLTTHSLFDEMQLAIKDGSH
jgi:tRNA-dihydrouridine synthase A